MYDGSDHEPVWHPLADQEPATAATPTPSDRAEGLRRVRRHTNWALAALVLGVGGATAALAHTVSAGHVQYATGAGATTGAAPRVGAPVATSSGSGVVASSASGAQGTAGGGATSGAGGDW